MSIVLHYFPLKARAHDIRLILNYTKTDYSEKIIEFTDWPQSKVNYEFKQLSMLEIDGYKLVQSKCIVRYLGMRLDLYPTDRLEVYQLESIWDQVLDWVNEMVQALKIRFRNDPDQRNEWSKTFFTQSTPQMLNYLESRLKQKDGKYLNGDQISVIDISIFGYISSLLFDQPSFKEQVDRLKIFDEHQIALKYLQDVKTELNVVFDSNQEWLKYEWAGFCTTPFEF